MRPSHERGRKSVRQRVEGILANICHGHSTADESEESEETLPPLPTDEEIAAMTPEERQDILQAWYAIYDRMRINRLRVSSDHSPALQTRQAEIGYRPSFVYDEHAGSRRMWDSDLSRVSQRMHCREIAEELAAKKKNPGMLFNLPPLPPLPPDGEEDVPLQPLQYGTPEGQHLERDWGTAGARPKHVVPRQPERDQAAKMREKKAQYMEMSWENLEKRGKTAYMDRNRGLQTDQDTIPSLPSVPPLPLDIQEEAPLQSLQVRTPEEQYPERDTDTAGARPKHIVPKPGRDQTSKKKVKTYMDLRYDIHTIPPFNLPPVPTLPPDIQEEAPLHEQQYPERDWGAAGAKPKHRKPERDQAWKKREKIAEYMEMSWKDPDKRGNTPYMDISRGLQYDQDTIPPAHDQSTTQEESDYMEMRRGLQAQDKEPPMSPKYSLQHESDYMDMSGGLLHHQDTLSTALSLSPRRTEDESDYLDMSGGLLHHQDTLSTALSLSPWRTEDESDYMDMSRGLLHHQDKAPPLPPKKEKNRKQDEQDYMDMSAGLHHLQDTPHLSPNQGQQRTLEELDYMDQLDTLIKRFEDPETRFFI